MSEPGGRRRSGFGRALAAGVAASLATVTAWHSAPPPRDHDGTPVIVQARDVATALAAVRAVGGRVTDELGIIDAVGATLSPVQARTLRQVSSVKVFEDAALRTAGVVAPGPPSDYTTLTRASELQALGWTGNGVTVAILDTGHFDFSFLNRTSDLRYRVKAQYDAIGNTLYLPGNTNATRPMTTDQSGHGTHITAIIASSRLDPSNKFNGIAPNVNLVSVKAFDASGVGTYLSVIRGINWVVQNKAAYNIRVLNCSFSAPVRSRYWQDPLNQAVMRAWKAGIVVVVSAGNGGPKPMSIGVPGNVPYVITVGAMTDAYTPSTATDDRLASFSATGPTYEGFAKPDLVAPGGHSVGIMDPSMQIPTAHSEFFFSYSGVTRYFRMSGTSQAAAAVSGVAALMLEADPTLSPNDVKCGLMATARAAWAGSTTPYSVFQQGAGLVNAYDAVLGGYAGCANGGLDIAKDLAGTQHYAGPAAQDATGKYYLMGQTGSGTIWNGKYTVGGYPWSTGYPWSNGYPWSSGYPWSTGYPWSNGYPWSTGYPWSSGSVEPASINFWVPQE